MTLAVKRPHIDARSMRDMARGGRPCPGCVLCVELTRERLAGEDVPLTLAAKRALDARHGAGRKTEREEDAEMLKAALTTGAGIYMPLSLSLSIYLSLSFSLARARSLSLSVPLFLSRC